MTKQRLNRCVTRSEDYQSIMETLEVLSDDEAAASLRRGIQEVKEGKAIPWKKAKALVGHAAE